MPTGKFSCDVCGFDRSRSVMRKTWQNLLVCSDTCWEPKPAWFDPPRVGPEGVPFTDARPEPSPIYASDDDPVTGDDL